MVNHLNLVPLEALGLRFNSHWVLSISWGHTSTPKARDLPAPCGGGGLHESRGLVGAKFWTPRLSKRKRIDSNYCCFFFCNPVILFSNVLICLFMLKVMLCYNIVLIFLSFCSEFGILIVCYMLQSSGPV